ncbi:CPBP family intramembrane glutamic endopeptidase [Microbacterium trichothecenolyticum]|nr:CPBP family intramembrane glutamic endopeptidase [Microbacterium trichothecenolyticum]
MVATMLSSRFRVLSKLRLNSIYTVATLLIATTGLIEAGPVALLRPESTWLGAAAGVAAAPILGYLAVLADGKLTERFRRRSREQSTTAQATGTSRRASSGLTPLRVMPAGAARQLGVQRRQAAPRVPSSRISVSSQPRQQALLWLVLVAVGEELLYRGVFLGWAMLFPPLLAGFFLALGTAVFGLIHISFGWSQVVAKLPLAIIGVATTLAFGTPLCAVLVHVYFNVYYWRKRRFSALSAAATPWSA